ncbi:hypothetical protein Aave_3618 [Paracidovorax citrulli AAC00-1]|uniref:Uncharacterized protein n=1 Tax=Paracidovorax citrulli (strain AAC00-1) TaxID=397945 RepID=A1TT81_PARC0|nr:hypothetical protein Aave_3618 [Paracidovorax citrulli AAC00-1]
MADPPGARARGPGRPCPLSEDLPILPGAIVDARPDRWGERVIRHIDRPARLSILEMLPFAGDDRLGGAGVTVSDRPGDAGQHGGMRHVV